KTYFLVLWWMSQTPYAAIFENQVAAEAAANVRNALMVTISGRDVKVDQVQDWYRRDESGAPMPAEWRDLVGQIHVPWLAKPKPSLLPRTAAAAPPATRQPSQLGSGSINSDRGEETTIGSERRNRLIHGFFARPRRGVPDVQGRRGHRCS